MIFKYAASAQAINAVTNNHYIRSLQNTHRSYTEYIRWGPYYFVCIVLHYTYFSKCFAMQSLLASMADKLQRNRRGFNDPQSMYSI